MRLSLQPFSWKPFSELYANNHFHLYHRYSMSENNYSELMQSAWNLKPMVFPDVDFGSCGMQMAYHDLISFTVLIELILKKTLVGI